MTDFLLSHFWKLLKAENIMWAILLLLVVFLHVRFQVTHEAAEARLDRIKETHTQEIDRLILRNNKLRDEIDDTKDRLRDRKVENAELNSRIQYGLLILERIEADCLPNAR